MFIESIRPQRFYSIGVRMGVRYKAKRELYLAIPKTFINLAILSATPRKGLL